MLALHAWRSADAIATFRDRQPERPLVVALTGTDIYRFQMSHPETTLASMAHADALIGLHHRVRNDIPADFHDRLHTVVQSATPPRGRLPPLRRRFEICIAGHLRDEKDPLRAAWAVRDVPDDSRLHVVGLGQAVDADWDTAARRETETNPRYDWRGEVPRWQVRRLMARARLMVLSSRMEGGANVVSEACVAGLPLIASDIPGNVGLLGEDYPGYYAVGDTAALRAQLLRAELDPAWLESLRRHCVALAAAFRPEVEQAAFLGVIDRVAK